MHWTKQGYPKEGFLKGSRLECYDDSRLINHGSIILRLQHYSKKSFQDHSFYVVETKTHKEIIVRHPASIRSGLVQGLCNNLAKRIAVVETKPKNSFQDHQLTLMARYYKGSRGANPVLQWLFLKSFKEETQEDTFETDSQTTSDDTGMSPLSRAPNGACRKLTPFKTPGSNTLTPFKTPQRSMDMLTSFKTLVERVTRIKSQIYGPCELRWVESFQIHRW